MSFENMSDEEIFAIANPIMDNLMDASTEIDHECYVQDSDDRMSKIVTKKHLKKVCVNYQAERGFFAQRTPVAVFKRPDSAAIVWKQYYANVPGEYVAEMILVKRDDRYLVDHAMIF